MISRLHGILLEAGFTSCEIDVNGVGYEVNIPMLTFEKLPAPGGEVSLYIYTQVREDAITLFGFATKLEKELFKLLISVNMIGGKVALGALSANLPAEGLIRAIQEGDLKMLSRLPGIGKRTAERIVVELRDKVGSLGSVTGEAHAVLDMPGPIAGAIEDALAAFEQLGFKREVTEPKLREVAASLPPDQCSSENLLRLALQLVNV